MNKLLMIAYHYPPVQGSSGLQRTLKFSKYLPQNGWQPMVLTVHPRAYLKTSDDLLSEIPDATIVKRAFALDTARHLSLFGRYPGILSRPDRWITWVMSAIPLGLAMIRKNKPQVIWSTYPIATAHLIGYLLHKLSGVPWVADLRDPMIEENFPSDPAQRRTFQWIEKRIAAHATKIFVTTRGTKRIYVQRYDAVEEKIHVIPNGYDEENFVKAEKLISSDSSLQKYKKQKNKITLIHSGILYPEERNPLPFFQAIAKLKKSGKMDAQNISIIFRASGHDELYEDEIRELGIEDIVSLAPGVDYIRALAEMTLVDGLLLFQAPICNDQIPAKLYEYLRAGKNIFTLSDPAGDTADILLANNYKYIVDIDDADAIEAGLYEFIQEVSHESNEVKDRVGIENYSRKNQTKLLANYLSEIVQ